MKAAEVSTDVLYYADADTNTKHKKKDAEVCFLMLTSHLRYKWRRISTWQLLGRETMRDTMTKTIESHRS
jgi:hypothetical protein